MILDPSPSKSLSSAGIGGAVTTKIFERISACLRGVATRDAPLGPLTTYEVGGPADVLVEPAGEADVVATVQFCRAAGVPLTVIGAGSNLLVSDAGVRGVVLRTADALVGVEPEGEALRVGAGVRDPELADLVAARGIDGFAFLADLPGSLGGAAVMNAGNNDGEMSDVLLEVVSVSCDGERIVRGAGECGLGYRQSVFRTRDEIVTSVLLRTDRRASPAALAERNQRVRETRAGKFPTERANCGSVFKRPAGDYAGRLIEAAGCKGLQIGWARVSERHAGFIVNLGGATAADIRAVVAEVQRRVRECSGVALEREVVYLGD